MASKKEKIQNNLWFVRTQLVRYLHTHFGIQTDFKFYANKQLKKKHKYIEVTFPDRRTNKWGTIEVDVCYDLLAGGKKQLMLDCAFKEATRVGMWFRETPYQDGHPEFEQELKLRGLTGYNATAETGLELHQYGCSACKQLYILKAKKLSKSKCPEAKGLLSVCCHQPIVYMQTKFYKNEILQRIKQTMDIGSEDE